MHHVIVNPADLHDPTPMGYAHTARIAAGAELVVIAGQYASGPDGGVVSSDLAEQIERTLHHLGIALASHDLQYAHVVQLRTYVVGLGPQVFEPLGVAMGQRWGTNPPPNTLLGVDSLAMPEIRFEMEAVAARS